MEKLTEVLSMGGNAVYIWPSFAFAAAVILGMVVTSMRSLRKAQRTLAKTAGSGLRPDTE